MLETTNFSIHACRFLYSAASGYFILSGGLAGLYFLRFREMFARRHFFLCFMLLGYTLSALFFTYGNLSPKVNRLLLSSLYILGPATFVVYVQMVVQLLHVKPRWLPGLLIPLRLLPLAMIFDLFLYFGFGKSLFIQNGGNPELNNWYMKMMSSTVHLNETILIVLIPAALSLLFINLLLLWQYRLQFRKAPLLRYGLIATLLTQVHDISITIADLPYLFLIAFAGYLLEVLRFNMSLLEGYMIHNDSMRARLKESLMSFAQVRLSKQILHDVKSIRRNILFKLESSLEPSPLNEILKHEINRLKVYENDDIKNPKEELCLADIVQTTTALFTKEFQEAGVKVKISIPEDITIKASKNDMLIVLINLIQNSLEELSGRPSPWIEFEAFETPTSIQLDISDSGDISLEERRQIFKAGYSSKGTSRGLGLNIVQESLAANNALISLCEETENTTFRIHFHKVC